MSYQIWRLQRAVFLTEQFLRDVAAVNESLHCTSSEDELIVAIEIGLVQLNGAQFLDKTYSGNLFQHHLKTHTPILGRYTPPRDGCELKCKYLQDELILNSCLVMSIVNAGHG